MNARQFATALRTHEERWLWIVPLGFMFVVSIYFITRYGGLWAEADSTTFTNVIRPIISERRLIPTHGLVYPNGYTYQAVSMWIIALTGLDILTLQQLIYPLVSVLIVLPAWALYRELTGSARGATLTTILLLMQPEFLFVILRSSHEKLTRALMLLCLLLLVRSFQLRGQPWLWAIHIALFYLCIFAFIASNNLMAHSFIVAVVMVLLLSLLLSYWRGKHLLLQADIAWQLVYITLICSGLVYVFTFYAYPPAQHDLEVLRTLADRLALLFLDVQQTGGQGTTNAYATVEAAWVSLPVYFLVSLANWIVLFSSFIIWVGQGWCWLVRGTPPPSLGAWLLWLCYAAFACQGALSVVADASGALSSNLQHRIFPSFAIVAVAVVGRALVQWQSHNRLWLLRGGLALLFAMVAVFSVWKASNEPLLSNKWTFYRTAELDALSWSDQHLSRANIWSEFDERLVMAFANAYGDSAHGNSIVGYLHPGIRYMLLSPIIRLRSTRLQRPLPVPSDALRIYDNGAAELYHIRPQTPYQR